MEEPPLPAGLSARSFPAKLWLLLNSPRVRSVRWDSLARGLLIERSLFERELLSPAGAQGPAPHTFRATRFASFVRQLHRYGFRKVPGWLGAAVPGDAGAWLHYSNPRFRRDRPELLLRVKRRPGAKKQRLAAGRGGFRRPPCSFHLLHRERPLPAGPAGQLPSAAPLCQNLGAASPGGLELPPGPSRTSSALTASSWAWHAPEEEELPVWHPDVILKELREIRRSVSERDQNIGVTPESPGGEPENKAAAEGALPGTVSHGNSSLEPEEPAPLYENLSAFSPEGLELPPGPSRTSPISQECEASPAPPRRVFVTPGLLELPSEEPGTRIFEHQPEVFFIPSYPQDLQSTSMALPEHSCCPFSEQHSPAYNPSATAGSSAAHALTGSDGCAASMASSWAWNVPGEEELPPWHPDIILEKPREIRRFPSERSPFAQGNISVAPESPGGEPENKAAAEGALPGTVSHGNSSLEPEEPDIHV